MECEGDRQLNAAHASNEEPLPEPLADDQAALLVLTRRTARGGAAKLSIALPDAPSPPSTDTRPPSSGSFPRFGVTGEGSAQLRRRTPQLPIQSSSSAQPPSATACEHHATPSADNQLMEVTFSPTSGRLFRQHSFTALRNGPTLPEQQGMHRSHSATRLHFDESLTESRDGPEDSLYSLRGGDRHPHHARTLTASSAGMESPASPRPAVIYSPTSGLYIPVRESKNYILSPVVPPFIPTSRNHSFLENIISSSSGEDDSLDSVCSQCHHHHFSRAHTDSSDANGSVAVSSPDHPQDGVLPPQRRRRLKRKELPVIEAIRDGEEATFAAATQEGAGRQAQRSRRPPERHYKDACCFHRGAATCGKRCSRTASTRLSPNRTKEEKEEAFDKAMDHMLKKSQAHSYNLLALGLDETQPLFCFDEVQEWQKYNVFIRTGYRSYYTTGMTLKSLLGWHNETVNIWSHFIGFIAFVILSVVLFATTLSTLVTAQSMSLTRLSYAVFCFGSIICMLNSAMYHLFTGHRKLKIFTLMGRLDFLGITILIVTSFIPPLYVMFHCNTNFRTFYISLICFLGFTGIVGPWTAPFHEHVWLRTAVYLGMALSGVVPALHALYLLPIARMNNSFFTSQTYGIVLMFILYGIGVFFYVMQLPESRLPGQFDTFLSSHQLWHFFVLMAAMVHYCNLVSMYQIWQLTDGVC